MNIPSELKYTASHEWVRDEADGSITVGITDHAQEALGDVVFIELPKAGQKVTAGGACGVIESVKAAADIYAPVSGEVVAVNKELSEAPEKLNLDAYEAWLFRLKPSDPRVEETLLNAQRYQATIAE